MPVIDLVPNRPYTIAGIASAYAGFTVQNQGATTVYFSQLQTINPDQNIFDYSVPPGGIVNWPKDEPCFAAIKTADLTGTISYAPLLADQNGVVGGSVSIAGTVPVEQNSSIDLLATWNTTVLANNSTPIFFSKQPAFPNNVDLSPYACLIMAMGTTATANVGASAAASEFTFYWLDSAGNQVATDMPIFSSNGISYYQIPCKTKTVEINIQVSAIAAHTALPIKIWGSRLLLPRKYFNNPANIGRLNNLNGTPSDPASAAAGFQGADISIAVAGTGTMFLSSQSGPAAFVVHNVTAAQTGSKLQMIDAAGNFANSTIISEHDSNAATFFPPDNLILPETPLVFTLAALAANRAVFSLGTMVS